MNARVVIVGGTRPNYVKIAPLLRAIRTLRAPVEPILVHTGQHQDPALSTMFFEELGVPSPDVSLDVPRVGGAAQVQEIITSLDAALSRMHAQPRGVVVVGDVNSTLAAALVATRHKLPIAHVEAGLRSFDPEMPEEVNRVVTDSLSSLHFVSEPSGRRNLLREGLEPATIVDAGNVMIDTLAHELPFARERSYATSLGLAPRTYGVVTLHRPSNVDDPRRLAAIVDLLATLAAEHPLVLPLHPRTRARLERAGLLDRIERIVGLRRVDPLLYRATIDLVAGAAFVLTDSGGVQEETSWLDVACFTLRARTERPITVSVGTNTLIGEALETVPQLVRDACAGRRRHARAIEGWDGHAAERVVAALADRWC